MGNFSDRIRKILNPKKQEQIEFNRRVGLNDDARVIPFEQMQKPHDAYFIRVKGNPNMFVKFFDGKYFYEENKEMACLWTLESGQNFITQVESPELELVRLDQIIKK